MADLSPGDALWTSYQIGNLATLIRTESRLSGRDKPAELAEAFAGGGDLAAALARFRDEKWNYYADPDAHPIDQPSPLFDQLTWLAAAGFEAVDVYWMKAGQAIYGGRKPVA